MIKLFFVKITSKLKFEWVNKKNYFIDTMRENFALPFFFLFLYVIISLLLPLQAILFFYIILLFIHLFTYLLTYLFIYLLIHSFIYLFIYLFISCLIVLSSVEVMVVQGNVLLALHAVHRMGFCTSSKTCAMIAIILQNYSKVKQARAQLIEQVNK